MLEDTVLIDLLMREAAEAAEAERQAGTAV
jgi:hypothetical protein